ncbi:MAG: hypothetical protein K9J30_08395 [Bacteroidales bacterium]|nr:hypothetical protein [Bacteroidales bacterium]
MRKSLLLMLLIFMVNGLCSAQHRSEIESITPNEKRNGRFFIVPETGFWFGSYTNIEIAPQIGYYIFDRWSLGLGPHYVFYKNNGYLSPDIYTTHIWGIKTFTRFSLIRDASEILPVYLFDELFAHIEYEKMNIETKYFNIPGTLPERLWVDYFYIGAGFNQQITAGASYFLMILWNLNNSIYSLYRNPTYRVGVNISF